MDEDFEKRIEEVKDILRKDNFSISYDELDEALGIIGELEEMVKTLENPLRPIETAPKDGTWILGYIGEHKNYQIMTWGYEAWHNSHWSIVNPTHWMPLPELEDKA